MEVPLQQIAVCLLQQADGFRPKTCHCHRLAVSGSQPQTMDAGGGFAAVALPLNRLCLKVYGALILRYVFQRRRMNLKDRWAPCRRVKAIRVGLAPTGGRVVSC